MTDLAITLDDAAVSTAPDGTDWEANSALTLSRYLNKTGGNRKKDGTLSKKGQTQLARKMPLIGESKSLSTQFAALAQRDQVTLSTSQWMIVGAMKPVWVQRMNA